MMGSSTDPHGSERRASMMFKPKNNRIAALIMALTLMVVMQVPVLACSGLELTSKEGDPYWFRTCDMDDTYNVFGEKGSYIEASYLVSYPAGQPIEFTTGAVTPEHTIIGMSFSDSVSMLDGINDAGLVGGLLFLNEGTETPDEDIPEGFETLAAMEGITWFLAQCKDVDEVIELANRTCMQALYVDGIPGSDLSATLHFTFIDAAGKSVVLETGDPEQPGRFVIFDSIGVMTNSPTYDIQMENLKAYIGAAPELRSQNIPALNMKGQEIEGISGGTDRTFPASNAAYDRFTRLAVLRYLCDEGNAIPNEEMLSKGNGIFACINVPEDNGKGTYYYDWLTETGDVEGAAPCYTQYTVCYDIARRTLAIRPYDTLLWTTLSIEDADPAAKAAYPILRGEEGGTINALEVNSTSREPVPAPATTPAAAESSNVNLVLAVICGVLAVAVIILAILFVRKKKA